MTNLEKLAKQNHCDLDKLYAKLKACDEIGGTVQITAGECAVLIAAIEVAGEL